MPIPAVTYVLSTAFAGGVSSAHVAYGSGGQTFDVLAALVAGGGNSKGVGGSFSVTDADIAAALDAYEVVTRSGTAGPPPVTNPVIGPLVASLLSPATGEGLVRQSDGLFHNAAVEQPANKNQNSGYAGLDSGGKLASGQLPSGAGGAMLTETRATPFTVYVDRNLGSDSNAGNSPGQAFQTLEKAINALQASGHGGVVKIIGVAPGPLNIAAPIHLVQGITIECAGGEAVALYRTFDTPNGRTVSDPVTTAGGGSVQSATAAFTSSDINRIVSIYRAGVGGGTFYDFISAVPDATHATLTATTAIACDAALRGAKMTIVGDWNRVVTDASMSSGGNVITSPTANWTNADVNREIVIAGAGQGGQALRAAIMSISGNTATITGKSSANISSKRCAIGTNFGDLFTIRAPSCGLARLILTDESSGANRIGSPIKLLADDNGAGSQTANAGLEIDGVRTTSTDSAGAWEHQIDIDGSWNQLSTGPGIRRGNWRGLRIFGARRDTETIRIAAAVHHGFFGEGIVGSAPVAGGAAGIMILDPLKTAGGAVSTSDVNLLGFECGGYFYCEGLRCNSIGGSVTVTVAVSGHRAIEFGPTSDHCCFIGPNHSSVNADEYDAGTNNFIETNTYRRRNSKAVEVTTPDALAFETFPRRGASNASQTVGSSGVMVLQSIWLPGGFSVSKVVLQGGGTSLAWGTGWSGQHFLMGLYDPDGNLLGQTADTGGTQSFSNAFVPLSLTAAVRAPRSGLHYIGLLINSGTGGSGFTYPTLGGMANVLAALAPALCATSGSGLTALPSTITAPPSSGQQSLEIYGGVS